MGHYKISTVFRSSQESGKILICHLHYGNESQSSMARNLLDDYPISFELVQATQLCAMHQLVSLVDVTQRF
jgi:hypothetical protein